MDSIDILTRLLAQELGSLPEEQEPTAEEKEFLWNEILNKN